MKTYAAVQHGPQQISIDELNNGKFLNQVSYWFASRNDAKAELDRLCHADQVEKFSCYVVGYGQVK